MLEALSIRYGGLLIPADECDYNSFRDMALLCPICRRSVYLAQGSNREPHDRKLKDGRSVAVKAAVTPTHFRHHPDVDRAVVEDCELRSSKITVVQRMAIASAAKNQRAKVLRSHLFRIVQTSPFMADHESFVSLYDEAFDRQGANPYLNVATKKILMDYLFNGMHQASNLPDLESRIDEMIRAFASETRVYVMSGLNIKNTDATVIESLELLSVIGAKMQSQIAREAFLFLVQPRQKAILEALIKHNIARELMVVQGSFGEMSHSHIAKLNQAKDIEYVDRILKTVQDGLVALIALDKKTMERFVGAMISGVLHILVAIDWGYQFEKLAKSN